MAEAYYLVTQSKSARRQGVIDGIHSVVGNYDDGSSDAEIIADAYAKVVAAGHPIRSDYFDTVVALTTAAPDDTDTIIFLPETYEIEEA